MALIHYLAPFTVVFLRFFIALTKKFLISVSILFAHISIALKVSAKHVFWCQGIFTLVLEADLSSYTLYHLCIIFRSDKKFLFFASIF